MLSQLSSYVEELEVGGPAPLVDIVEASRGRDRTVMERARSMVADMVRDLYPQGD